MFGQEETQTARRISDLAQSDPALVVRILLRRIPISQHDSALGEILQGKRPFFIKIPEDTVRVTLDFLSNWDATRLIRTCRQVQATAQTLLPGRTVTISTQGFVSRIPVPFLTACEYVDLSGCRLGQLDVILARVRAACPRLKSVYWPAGITLRDLIRLGAESFESHTTLLSLRPHEDSDANTRTWWTSWVPSIQRLACTSPEAIETLFPNVHRLTMALKGVVDPIVWLRLPRLTALKYDVTCSESFARRLSSASALFPPQLQEALLVFDNTTWCESVAKGCLDVLNKTCLNLKKLTLIGLPDALNIRWPRWVRLDRTTLPTQLEVLCVGIPPSSRVGFDPPPGFCLATSDFPKLRQLAITAYLPCDGTHVFPLCTILSGSSPSVQNLTVQFDHTHNTPCKGTDLQTWIQHIERVFPCLIHLSLFGQPDLWKTQHRDSLVDTALHLFSRCPHLQTIQWGTYTLHQHTLHRHRLEADLESFVKTLHTPKS